MEKWQKCVDNLRTLIESRSELKEALAISIQKAGFHEVQTVDDYYRFINDLLTQIPTQRDMSPATDKFHYLISQSPNNILKKDPGFRDWLVDFSKSHGTYLDTTASVESLDTFLNDPEYHIEDYHCGASGWLTFNQFFSRHVKPGKRPVDAICNSSIIVSPADSVYKGAWPIDENSQLVAKGVSYSVIELIDNSAYRDKFKGGIFTHSYLNSNDYHRFHVPVGGTIVEVKQIPGDVIVNTVKSDDGSLETLDEVGFQFSQARGLVIIESAIGFVAALPIGMGHVSSVTLSVDAGTNLVKGEEFGYFSYGGSDMVMLFETGKIEFTATVGVHYKQGEKIATEI